MSGPWQIIICVAFLEGTCVNPKEVGYLHIHKHVINGYAKVFPCPKKKGVSYFNLLFCYTIIIIFYFIFIFIVLVRGSISTISWSKSFGWSSIPCKRPLKKTYFFSRSRFLLLCWSLTILLKNYLTHVNPSAHA